MSYSEVKDRLNGDLTDNLNQEHPPEEIETQMEVVASIPGYSRAREIRGEERPPTYTIGEYGLDEVPEEEITVEETVDETLPEISAELLGKTFEEGRFDDEAIYLAVEDVDSVITSLAHNTREPDYGPLAGNYTALNDLMISSPYERGKESVGEVDSVEELKETSGLSAGEFRDKDFKRGMKVAGAGTIGTLGSTIFVSPEVTAVCSGLTMGGSVVAMMATPSMKAGREYKHGKEFQSNREGSRIINEEITDEIGDIGVRVSEW